MWAKGRCALQDGEEVIGTRLAFGSFIGITVDCTISALAV